MIFGHIKTGELQRKIYFYKAVDHLVIRVNNIILFLNYNLIYQENDLSKLFLNLEMYSVTGRIFTLPLELKLPTN